MRIRFYTLLAFFALLFSEGVAQQNGYYIRNYLPKEYGGYSQMWQAVQDKNGLLYFACTSNIFIYDGFTWEKVLVKQGAANRQVAYDSTSGTVYVGSVSELGYLQRAFDGKWTYKSLLDKLPEKYRAFADTWKVHIVNGYVYFQASERFFVFKHGDYVGSVDANKDGFALSFTCDNRLFVRHRNVGLQEVVGTKLQSLPGGDVYGTIRLLAMIPWNKDTALVLSGDRGFTLMAMHAPAGSTNIFSPFYLPPDEFLLNAVVLGARWVNDSIFSVISRSGLGFYGKDGRLREMISKETGLADESVSEIFVDREKNLWVMTNFGLSRISYNSPILYYDNSLGVKGSFEDITHQDGQLYIGSMDGVWRGAVENAQAPNRMHFTSITPFKTECWSMQHYGSDLLACTGSGIYRVKGTSCELLYDHNTTMIVPSMKVGELFTAENGGFSYVQMQPGQKPGKIVYAEFPSEELLRMAPADTIPGKPELRSFWCANRFWDIFHVTMNVSTGTYDYSRYDSLNGVPTLEAYPFFIGDSLYLLNYDQCYRYVPSRDKGEESKCFFPAPDIYEQLYNGDISRVRQPFDYRLFQVRSGDSLAVFGSDAQGRFTRKKVVPNDIAAKDLQYAFVQPGGTLWLMSLDMILHVDPSRKTNKGVPFHAMIRRMTIGSDSTIFFGSDSRDGTLADALPFRFNSVSFHFAAPFFDHEEHVGYSYMLEGYDTAWTKWSHTSTKDYTNLHEGTYTFRVKAVNTYDEFSTESSYTFTILPPWYRTGWAYALYALAFAGSIWLSVRLGARHMRKQKEKLEVLVNERTAEVVEKKHQIELQKLELETAYTDIKDSINYAQRIQQAILPVQEDIHLALPDSFLFFQPRDIVSGDFFWFITREEKTYIACVDCTGHGVPGALMSMIGNTLLNQLVLEKKITAPDEILNELHVGVRHALRQDAGGETRDGMDIALCVIDTAGGTLSYAGANRPLWLIRRNELLETKADKQPIAGDQMEEERKFRAHTVLLQPGDCVYLSTDGYADQFGGAKGKKFMVKRFQQLLLQLHQLPMNEQKARIENAFFEWKGNLEQVDDVLVIGFRINLG